MHFDSMMHRVATKATDEYNAWHTSCNDIAFGNISLYLSFKWRRKCYNCFIKNVTQHALASHELTNSDEIPENSFVRFKWNFERERLKMKISIDNQISPWQLKSECFSGCCWVRLFSCACVRVGILICFHSFIKFSPNGAISCNHIGFGWIMRNWCKTRINGKQWAIEWVEHTHSANKCAKNRSW